MIYLETPNICSSPLWSWLVPYLNYADSLYSSLYGLLWLNRTFAFPQETSHFSSLCRDRAPLNPYCHTAFPAASHLWNSKTNPCLNHKRCVPAFPQGWICFHREVSKQHCNFSLYHFNQDSPSAYSRALLPAASCCALLKASHYCMYHLDHVIYCKHDCL